MARRSQSRRESGKLRVELAGLVMEVMSEARCSCSWKAESRSEREVRGAPVVTSRDLVPGRMRRVATAGAGAAVAVAERDFVGTGRGIDGGAIWTSVKGGGEGRRCELGMMVVIAVFVVVWYAMCGGGV